MMFLKLYEKALGASLSAGVIGVGIANSVLSVVPGYVPARDMVLDTLLGPAEDFEYIQPTTPRT